MQQVAVEVWSDIACPWCWVGKRHLEQAIAAFDGEVRVRWRAFELNPGAIAQPAESVDYVQLLAAKYHTSGKQAQAMIDRMVRTGATVGLDFRFDRVRPCNTFDAHRLLVWAGVGPYQTALKEQLFFAYMTDGQLVSDHRTLVGIAAEVGLDADQAGVVLATGLHADAVRAEQRQAAEFAVTGVPFFVIDGRYGVSGAQPSDVLLGALRQVDIDASGTDACGPDGCGLPS